VRREGSKKGSAFAKYAEPYLLFSLQRRRMKDEEKK
jgi:hypothetical protein